MADNENMYSNLYLPKNNNQNMYSSLYLPKSGNLSNSSQQSDSQSFMDQIKNAIIKMGKFAGHDKIPPGINIASGAISSFLPQDQRELAANLPQVATGTIPSTSEQVEHSVGSYLPYAAGGGSSLLGQAAAAGAYGASNYKEGEQGFIDKVLGQKSTKTSSGIENAAIAALLHVSPSLLPITKNGIVNKILMPYDKIENRAQEGFQQVSQGVKDRGIDKIPFTEKNITLYHGTNPSNAKSILENGLTSRRYENWPTLTDNSEAAETYGAGRMGAKDAESQVMKISIPESKFNEYIHPHSNVDIWKPRGYEKSQLYTIKKPIPNEYISKLEDQNIKENAIINIDDIRDYFPNTKANNKLLENAETGDYDSLRKLQSDLYTRGKKNLQSDLQADRDRGEEMLDKRNDINQAISTHLKNTGNEDLGKILDSSIKDWRTLQDVYYNKNMNNAIKKLVNPDIRKIPNNLPNILKEKSIPMQKFKDFHPGLESAIKKYILQKTLSSKGLQYGLPAGIGGATVYELMKHD